MVMRRRALSARHVDDNITRSRRLNQLWIKPSTARSRSRICGIGEDDESRSESSLPRLRLIGLLMSHNDAIIAARPWTSRMFLYAAI